MHLLNTLYLIYLHKYIHKYDGQGYEVICKTREETDVSQHYKLPLK